MYVQIRESRSFFVIAVKEQKRINLFYKKRYNNIYSNIVKLLISGVAQL